MALKLVPTSQFKRDYKRMKSAGSTWLSSKLCLISFAQTNRLRSGIAIMSSLVDMQASVNVISGPTGSLCTR